MNNFKNFIVTITFVLLASGCIAVNQGAQSYSPAGNYKVRPTDTLYSIAWRYDLDYQALADWNNISVDATIHPGQILKLIEPDKKTTVQPTLAQSEAVESIPESPKVTTRKTGSENLTATAMQSPGKWIWPTRGENLNTFAANKLDRRGIDIGGTLGQPIHAVANGKVVYSGNGLAGYGNLIIVKHSDTYLSAYAYCQERLVKEGMSVTTGMVIAKMGQHKNEGARLHFEIRKNGKPVNPLIYLPKKNA